ncbi:MAG: PAS domain S-box protein [Fidelibacterota bacterium]
MTFELRKKLFKKEKLVPALIFILLATVIASGWTFTQLQKKQNIIFKTDLITSQVGEQLKGNIDRYLEVLRLLREEWIINSINTEVKYEKVVGNIISGYDGFHGINYIDPEGVIRWIVPETPNIKAKNKDLHDHPFAAETFILAEKTRKDYATPVVELWQGGLGLATYFPLIRDGQLEGYLNGVFKIHDFVQHYFDRNIDNYFYLSLKEDGHEFYTTEDNNTERSHSISSGYPIIILNRSWELSLSPKTEYFQTNASKIEKLTLLLLLTLSGVTSYGYRLVLIRRNELKNSEKKYRDLFEKSEDALLIIKNGHFVDCNQATVKMLGYDHKKEFLNMHPSELSPARQPDGRRSLEKADEMMKIALDNGSNRFEWNYKKADGEVFLVEVLLTTISSDDETSIIHTVWRDISEREQSDRMKSAIYQISDSAHRTKNLNSLYKSIYECLQKVLNVTNFYIAVYNDKTELLSFPFLVDEQDSKPIPKPLGKGLTEHIIRKGQPLYLETKDIQKLNRDGIIDLIGTLPRQWLGSPLIANGKVIGVITVQNYKKYDVYEQQDLDMLVYVSEQIALAIAHMQSEKELEVEKTYLEELFTNSPEAVALVDIDSNILRINSEFTSLFGFTESEVIGNNIDELICSPDQEKSAQVMTQQVQKGRRVFSDAVRRKKDGTLFPVSILGSPIKYKGGILAIYAVYRDISERKNAENELRMSEKTHRLLSEQLTEANIMKETLLDVISHDLKNPAGVILGFAELLQEENGENDIVRGIRNSSKSLINVIENATILSKVTLGETVQFELLDLVKIIKDISEEFKPQFSNNGMQLDVNLPDSLPISGNQIIGEIFKNYLSNAIKYASDGKKVIINSKLTKKSVTILFNDLGTTIPVEERKIVFERGRQLGDGEKRGRGLGLAIVKRIAEAHNGQVWVEPNEPSGNRFCLRLPLPGEGSNDVQ